jgi:dienelactone hydrolase
MVAGIDRSLMRAIDESVARRSTLWSRDLSSVAAYNRSVEPNREHLRQILGVVAEDTLASPKALELISSTEHDSKLAETKDFTVHAVRWPVLTGVHGEGLLLEPKGKVKARIIVLPDADQTPEMLVGLAEGVAPASQVALRFARLGCEVVVPVLVSRESACSGNAELNVWTNEPHREWLYRMSFEMGRHVIGYELQKVFALVAWMDQKNRAEKAPLAVAGYGEGGLIAMHAAALDTRIQGALVSGYLRNRQRVWEEPLYRNVFGVLREFGDAEVATLIAPRMLVVEYSRYPQPSERTTARPGAREVAAPGKLSQPAAGEVLDEMRRARALTDGRYAESLRFVAGAHDAAVPMFSAEAVQALFAGLNVPASEAMPPEAPRRTSAPLPDVSQRQQRQVQEIQDHTQRLLHTCEAERHERFWKKVPTVSVDKFTAATKGFRSEFVNQVIGRYPAPSLPLKARSCLLSDNEAFSVYDVTLDRGGDLFAWGLLAVPKNIKAGERRPVVVCQHGLEGLPEDCLNENANSDAYKYYKGFAAALARQGFVTFSPHNPYRGHDGFRMLQRKLNPLGLSLFSVIIAQHQTILEWLGAQPFVDQARVGFYGLSYGGKSAMRIPAALDGYCLSICSGDFNDWIRKTISVDFPASYLFTGEWEIVEWSLGRTFNYAEMAALIAPRPFMVERGHDDGCGVDEWIASEYAKVHRLYDRLGLSGMDSIEYFNGPHTINGKGTFEFLHTHLNWSSGQP